MRATAPRHSARRTILLQVLLCHTVSFLIIQRLPPPPHPPDYRTDSGGASTPTDLDAPLAPRPSAVRSRADDGADALERVRPPAVLTGTF